MKKKSEDNTQGIESGKYLDCSKWSVDWQEWLEQASLSYPRLGIQTIHMVLPVPGKKATLVFYDDNQCYYSTFRTLTTLLRRQEADTFYNYYLTSKVLKQLKGFQQRRLPMIHGNFALFPLSAPANAIWLNPLSIDRIWEEPERRFIKMATGPGLIVTIRQHAIEKYAVNALIALTCAKRDSIWMMGDSTDKRPLDYLELPDTPFVDLLSHKEDFRDFPIECGDFFEHYSFQHALAQLIERYPLIDFDTLTC